MINIFEKLRKETQGSIIIISHQERILEIADHIVIIADGEITEQGEGDHILPHLLCNVGTCEYFRKRA